MLVTAAMVTPNTLTSHVLMWNTRHMSFKTTQQLNNWQFDNFSCVIVFGKGNNVFTAVTIYWLKSVLKPFFLFIYISNGDITWAKHIVIFYISCFFPYTCILYISPCGPLFGNKIYLILSYFISRKILKSWYLDGYWYKGPKNRVSYHKGLQS